MKQHKLKWAYFEPLYSVFLNTQNSPKVMFKKKILQTSYIQKKIHAQRIHLKKIHAQCLWPPPPPPSHQI